MNSNFTFQQLLDKFYTQNLFVKPFSVFFFSLSFAHMLFVYDPNGKCFSFVVAMEFSVAFCVCFLCVHCICYAYIIVQIPSACGTPIRWMDTFLFRIFTYFFLPSHTHILVIVDIKCVHIFLFFSLFRVYLVVCEGHLKL